MTAFERRFAKINGAHEITPIQIREHNGDAMIFIDIGCPMAYGGCDGDTTEMLLRKIVREKYIEGFVLKPAGFDFTDLGYQGCDNFVIPPTIVPEETKRIRFSK